MKKLALLMMVVLSMVTFTGCFGPPPANAMTVSEEKVWPVELPNSVPKVDVAKIAKVTTLKNSTLIEVSEITEADYKAYVEEVTKAGWEVAFESAPGSAIYKNGEARLDVTRTEDGKMLVDYSKSMTAVAPEK
ncbi:MAG: hypothetical protein ACRCW2_04605 [Cellulosilyticaceae bacterium]